MAAATLSELLDKLAEVRQAIWDLTTAKVPLEGDVGRTSIKLTENVKALYRLRDDLRIQIQAERRRLGYLTRAVRRVY